VRKLFIVSLTYSIDGGSKAALLSAQIPDLVAYAIPLVLEAVPSRRSSLPCTVRLSVASAARLWPGPDAGKNPSGVKTPRKVWGSCGTTEVVPCYKIGLGAGFSAACGVLPSCKGRLRRTFSAARRAGRHPVFHRIQFTRPVFCSPVCRYNSQGGEGPSLFNGKSPSWRT
jgi:hypothetical protein